MREQGLDALVLLGNTNVAYATGAIWPLADSGRANFEQPVAVVLADDEWPHLFTPMREDDRLRREDAGRTTSTAPSTSTSTRACSSSPRSWPAWCRASAVIAMDEWTNALRREQSILFAPGRPSRRRGGSSARPRRPRRPTSCRACARACGSPSWPSPTCRPRSRPASARPT